jgi:hypothetical protein
VDQGGGCIVVLVTSPSFVSIAESLEEQSVEDKIRVVTVVRAGQLITLDAQEVIVMVSVV